MSDYIVRTGRPGEASLVVHFYYKLFEEQFAFLPQMEQYFLHAMEDLFGNTDGNRLFVAERDGEVIGALCVVRLSEQEAQLRMFGVWGQQGKGIGKALMDTAMTFCREQGYHHVILWSIDDCEAARHLYGKYGFERTETKRNIDWASYPITEEKWEYTDTAWKKIDHAHRTRYWETIL